MGEGTTFIIYLPALQDRPTEFPSSGTSAMPLGHGELVLVVEDETAVRASLAESLEQLNYQILEATNGKQALNILEKHGEHIALVLSDVVMPDMGGIALLHALREKGYQAPLVLLTGHPMNKELDELKAQGLTAWLTKPLSLERLARVVDDALGS
jgi:CheY-like chemotaxis protein